MEKGETVGFIKYFAIKRFGHVNEIANLLAFCASEKAGYLTGANMVKLSVKNSG